MGSIRKPASTYISLVHLCVHSSVRGCPSVCACQGLGAWVWVGRGAHLALPGAAVGARQGAAGSSRHPPAAGRLRGEVQQFCKQRPLSEMPTATSGAALQRSSVQSWKEASGFCREPVTSRPPPGSLEGLPPLCHTPARATQKHCWSFLENMCTWMQILQVQSGAGLVLELPPARPQQKPCSWFPLSPSQDWELPTTGRCQRC